MPGTVRCSDVREGEELVWPGNPVSHGDGLSESVKLDYLVVAYVYRCVCCPSLMYPGVILGEVESWVSA